MELAAWFGLDRPRQPSSPQPTPWPRVATAPGPACPASSAPPPGAPCRGLECHRHALFEVTCLPSRVMRRVRSWFPGGSGRGTMTNWPDLSATARSYTSPLRSNSTVASGSARPATTVSPVGSTLTTSNSRQRVAIRCRRRPCECVGQGCGLGLHLRQRSLVLVACGSRRRGRHRRHQGRARARHLLALADAEDEHRRAAGGECQQRYDQFRRRGVHDRHPRMNLPA